MANGNETFLAINASAQPPQLQAFRDKSGLERVVLANRGDLQRLLSCFFGQPIGCEIIYANTSPRTQPASPEFPITQMRQVRLTCGLRTVCTATSTVTITAPEPERLILDEKYPLGQMFQMLRRVPAFSLLNISTSHVNGKEELQRIYKLETDGVACATVEVFPDRTMFSQGEAWLHNEDLIMEQLSMDLGPSGGLASLASMPLSMS
ncbi:hypothetical protein CONPUDRAFT_126327 [Coniophora puteana RWD-64-598 SS2]|uniref:Uncharacterized protein n=1 Tax=Coniophora puteana (strain RWD-64-598) TaxID=741705 RepID=A0A5M3MKW3_CONPW|nr:uncharacterized protein CONPUDRAFT_126327 [Coniophora puteana RWD-64-598 SS2]EIW79879.1 hypothetical protein CONPUDRAFT_126327 [Coniophora puteana RWD-64-598 SS2]